MTAMSALLRLAHNRKRAPLPAAHTLAPDDPRLIAVLLTQARHRKGWSLLTLRVQAGVSRSAVARACLTGHVETTTLLKLAAALDLTLPQLPHLVTAHEAHHGR